MAPRAVIGCCREAHTGHRHRVIRPRRPRRGDVARGHVLRVVAHRHLALVQTERLELDGTRRRVPRDSPSEDAITLPRTPTAQRPTVARPLSEWLFFMAVLSS